MICMGCLNDITVHHRIIVNKFSRVGIIGMNTAHNSGQMKNVVWPMFAKIGRDFRLVTQIKFCMGWGEYVVKSLLLQQSNERSANHARAARDEDFCFMIHSV